jgi:arginyl-tRNA--protein-N-Asp/Glu arginylyltransferase
LSIERRNFPQFFITAATPCPYLKGKQERKVFTHLVGPEAAHLNDMLSQGGFRRSQNIAYRPSLRSLHRLRIGAGSGECFPAQPGLAQDAEA